MEQGITPTSFVKDVKEQPYYEKLREWLMKNNGLEDIIRFKGTIIKDKVFFDEDPYVNEYLRGVNHFLLQFPSRSVPVNIEFKDRSEEFKVYLKSSDVPYVKFCPTLNYSTACALIIIFVEAASCEFYFMNYISENLKSHLAALGGDAAMKLNAVLEMTKPIDNEQGCGSEPKQPSYSETGTIFSSRIFTRENHYKKIYSIISRFIYQNDGSEPGDLMIDPSCQAEWYYIYKGISEANITKSLRKKITHFVNQMFVWFPNLFKQKDGESEDRMIRRYMMSISREGKKWRNTSTKKEVPIEEMVATMRTKNYNEQESQKFINIAKELSAQLKAFSDVLRPKDAKTIIY